MSYLDQARVEFDWEFPLGEIILDFFDRLKTSRAATRASTTRCSSTARATS
jgi:translation elongation factor EF-4